MSAGGRYLRFLLLAGLVATGAGAIGGAPTRAAAGAGGVPAMVAALAVCWIAAAIGGLPVLRAAAREATPAAMLAAVFAAMALRLAAVALGAAAVVVGGTMPTAPFLLWTGIGYVALLVVETRYAVGEVRRQEREGGSAAAPRGSGAGDSGKGRDGGLERPATNTETR